MGIFDLASRQKIKDDFDDRSTVLVDEDGLTLIGFEGERSRYLWSAVKFIRVSRGSDDHLSYLLCKSEKKTFEVPANSLGFEDFAEALRKLPNWDEERFDDEMALYLNKGASHAFIWERDGVGL